MTGVRPSFLGRWAYIEPQVPERMPAMALPSPRDPRDGARFILALDARLESVDRAILVASWNLQLGRSKVGSEPWQLKRARLLSDDRLLTWVRSALGRSWPFLLRRRLELFERALIDARVEQDAEVVRRRSELSRRVIAFRPLWKGKRVERAVVARVFRTSPRESERRAAFYSLEPLERPLEGPLRELIELRNERARALGFRTMAEMRHRADHLTPGQVLKFAEIAARVARPRLRALRDSFREATGQSGWHPWDFEYARERAAPLPDDWFPQEEMLPRILAAVRRWGIRTDRMRFRVAFHDSPFGGMTIPADPPRDVRILVHSEGGWHRYMILFHEVGHAVHAASIRAPRHLLRWTDGVPGFGACNEGIAGLFEDIPNSLEWLSTQPGVDRARAEEFARTQRDGNILWAARHACWTRTEERLYERPDLDPVPEAQRFEREVLGYDDYRPRSFVDAFLVEDPLYTSSYLLAILFGRQLARTMRDRFGEPLWPNPKVGPWLTRNWFAPGSLYDWVPRVQELTGRPFGIEAFRAEAASL